MNFLIHFSVIIKIVFSPIANLRGTTLQSELNELENLNSSQSDENIQLRRDQMILTNHVAELQEKVYTSIVISMPQFPLIYIYCIFIMYIYIYI